MTHNRCEELSRCLAAIRRQGHAVDHIIVVDNASSDDTPKYLASKACITAVRLADNVGGAGGFSVGMRLGIDRGADWLWLLDDDCVPDHTCLERLVGAARECAEPRIGALSPGVGATPYDAVFGYLRNPSRTLRVPRQTSPDAAPAVVPIDWAAFAGLLMRAHACASTGPIRDDFVIWNDDTEYCLRMRVQGWSVIGVPSAFVWHAVRPHIVGRVLGREFSVRQADPRLEFFGVRNLTYVDWMYRNSAFRDGRPLTWRVLHEAFSAGKVLIIDRELGPARARARLHGLAVALLTVAGRRDGFHDQLASSRRGVSRSRLLFDAAKRVCGHDCR